MAVIIANTTKGNATQTGGTLNISVSRASGEGLLLGIQYGYEWGAADTISSVVWDSAGDNQAFTHVLTNQQEANNRYIAVYYLSAPTSAKTGNITVTFSGSINNISAYIVRHITGHNTSAMISGSAQRDESDALANDLPITISSATGELVVAFCGIRDELAMIDAGDFSDYQEQLSSLSVVSMCSGSKAGAASVTGTFAYSGGANYDNALIAVSIAGAAGASETITLTPDPSAVSIGTNQTITITRSVAAPAGGVTYNLTSGTPATATVPATATILEGNTSVTFTATSVGIGTTVITATNAADSGETDSVTHNVTSVLVKKAKFVVHSDFQSATNITIDVFQAPGAGALTGARLGAASGINAEATLEGGQAVIKVPATSIGATGLSVGTSVRAVFKGTTSASSPLGNAVEGGSVATATGSIIEE